MTNDEFRQLVAEHGSWQEAALANPDRREEILDAACTNTNEVRAAGAPVLFIAARECESFDAEFDRFVQDREAEREAARVHAQDARIRDLQERALEATLGASQSHGDMREPGRIPFKLVEEAVRLHERDKLGRRRLAEELPGLTEYQAGQILAWYRVGRPAGLWLDEEWRLKWSAVISTTTEGVRLPRI